MFDCFIMMMMTFQSVLKSRFICWFQNWSHLPPPGHTRSDNTAGPDCNFHDHTVPRVTLIALIFRRNHLPPRVTPFMTIASSHDSVANLLLCEGWGLPPAGGLAPSLSLRFSSSTPLIIPIWIKSQFPLFH